MKKVFGYFTIFITIICMSFIFNYNVKASTNINNKVKVYLFYGDGCPHCKKEKELFNDLRKKYGDSVEFIYYEVWNNEENAKLMDLIKEKMGNDQKGVPYTVIGSNAYIGYNENVGYAIEKTINSYLEVGDPDTVSSIINDNTENIDIDAIDVDDGTFVVPIIGKINAAKVSLPLMATVIGFVDGFNPCAMWVLLFLLSILIGMKNKKRAFFLGITFLVASASVYLIFMVAWLNVALSMNSIIWIRNLIAVVALIGAAINLRSFFKKSEDGCTVSDAKKKRKIFEKIKHFTSEKSFVLATIGIITLAVSVNLIELACSAGLPLLFTQILSFNNLSSFEYGLYIGIYILFFMIDDLIIFFIAMFTMKVTGISNKYTKWSHLIGGLIMLIIGILLLVKPGVLMFNM